MMYFVLGYDGAKVIMLTSKIFDNEVDAKDYADRCGSLWRAFVVREVAL